MAKSMKLVTVKNRQQDRTLMDRVIGEILAIGRWQMAILLACAIYLLPHSVRAERDELVSPPVCKNNLSQTVIFETRDNDRGKYAAGMARRDGEGRPVIYRFNYRFAPAGMQHFIDLHECAHHQTGDIDRPHPPRNSPEHLMNESIADCIAILRIRDEFDKPARLFDEITAQLRTDMSAAGFPEISVSSRLSNITNCYADYPPAEQFISRILQDRE